VISLAESAKQIEFYSIPASQQFRVAAVSIEEAKEGKGNREVLDCLDSNLTGRAMHSSTLQCGLAVSPSSYSSCKAISTIRALA
jgi:hypothetical protein